MPSGNRPPRLEWLRSAHLPGVEFLACDTDSTLWHIFHERYVVCAVDEASADVRYRGKVGPLFDGCTMLMDAGEAHRNMVVPRPQSFRAVFFDPALFKDAAKNHGLTGTPHFRSLLTGEPELLQTVYRLCASVEAQDTPLEQQSLALKCMRLALTHAEEVLPSSNRRHDHAAIRRARTYLQERFNEPVSLDELSAHAGLSPYHLVRSFNSKLGMPPHAFQNRVRVERARTLLKIGMPLAVVASAVGFADQSHFTRHFRRVFNITPGAYARVGGPSPE
jgi:AraC-like DNA-binding protein